MLGQQYHYGTNVPNHTKVLADAGVLFDRNLDGQIQILEKGTVASITEEDRGRKTEGGQKIVDKIAIIKNYRPFRRRVTVTEEIESLFKQVQNYNNQHSIRPITKEVFEKILAKSEMRRAWSRPKFAS